MAKENIEIQIHHGKAMAKNNGFAVRTLINYEEKSPLELNKETMLHIGAILLNASNWFIKNADKI